MVLSSATLEYFRSLAAKVTQGMTRSNRRVPYAIEDDRVLQAYETIRAVWRHGSSVFNACRTHDLPRSSYYTLEQRFIDFGVWGLFPSFAEDPQKHDLEQLVVLAKTARPSLSHTALLRLAQAIPLTRADAELDAIANVLNSHGLGISQLETDPVFFGRIQRTLEELQRRVQSPIGGRDKAARRQTFLSDTDPVHKRLEILRELFYGTKTSIKDLCAQYGLPVTTFYFLMKEYRLYGAWAVLPASHPGSKINLSAETQLRIIIEKLRHPTWSGQQVIDALSLRCDRNVVLRMAARWELDDKRRPPIALDHYTTDSESEPDLSFKSPTTAVHLIGDASILKSRRLNRHFTVICNKMRMHGYHLCDPGPLLLAPFVSELGIVQAFETYGPTRLRGTEVSNLALLNVMRILGGYPRVHHLRDNRDRSVALASGLGMFGSRSRFYEDTIAFKFPHLQKMRNDLVARAIELGLIDGKKVAFDFHFKEFYGSHAADKGIGKGPAKSGDLVPGFRPHVAWDLANNVILTLAYYQGAIRGPTIIRRFCEQNIFSILDRHAIEEIYMDSEYTKEGDIHYFKELMCSNGEVYMCLKRNKQVKKLIAPALEEDNGWQPADGDDEKKRIDVILPRTKLPLVMVILRNREKKDHIRCFGSTNVSLSLEDVLRKYRYRWHIENGLKDLVESYFLDDTYSNDPEKNEFEFYCVMVARLAYESFLKAVGGEYFAKEDGTKYTLTSMRTMLLEKRNCLVDIDADENIRVTLLEAEMNPLERRAAAVYEELSRQGRNKVLWWGNRGVKLVLKNQFGSQKCPTEGTKKCPPDPR